MIFISIFLAGLFVSAAEKIEDGKSKHDSIDALLGGTRAYKFHIKTLKDKVDLSFSVTTFSDWSDPDLYAAEDRTPTPQDYDWYSATWGSDSLVIPHHQLKNQTDYYILISCFTYCRYTLTASYVHEIQLVDGQPMTASLKKGFDKVFNFTVTEPTEQLQISLIPTKGSVEMSVTPSDVIPSIENTLPVSDSWHSGQMVSISNPDVGTTYRILVVAIEKADFTVKASTSQALHLLQASVPTQGSVDSKKFNYYMMYVDDPTESVLISVSPFVGDPDIYVKYDERPSLTDYNFRSLQFGNETMSITKHDRQTLNATVGWYYIGIYGFTQSQYTITVSINRDSSVPLLPGVPQSGYADYEELDLYYLDIPDAIDQNITISLTILQGNPDLYAKLCNDTSATFCEFSNEELSDPSDYRYIYSSLSDTGEDVLYIPHKGSYCTQCRYAIVVYGRSPERSNFILTGSYYDDIEHVLMDGVPWKMSAPKDGYRYFRFTVANDQVRNTTFILTPYTGDPDLFVSRNVAMPKYDTAEKTSRNTFTNVDSVVYSKGEDGSSLNGTYHITVYSMTMSTFTLVAQSKELDKNSTIALVPGQPQLGTLYNLTDSDYKIYSFNLDYTDLTKQPVRIVLTPTSGKYDIYVTSNPDNLNLDKDIFYYDWSTTNQTRLDHKYVINIPITHKKYKPSSTYLVLVIAHEFSSDDSASYSIMYATGDWPIRLREGAAYMDEINGNNTRYYLFPIYSSNEDVNIILTALTGDPDLYMSLNHANPRPSRDNFDFSSIMYGSEKYTLNWELGLEDACPYLPESPMFGERTTCMLYIAVTGYFPSTYTILVNSRRQYPTQLILNYPQSGQLNESEYGYYFTYLSTSKSVEISLQSNVGDSDLFLNILDKEQAGNDVTNWHRPSKEIAMFFSMSPVSTDHIQISSTELQLFCNSGECIGIIGVYCFSGICRYTVSGRQNDVYVLSEGENTYGVVDTDKFMYYDFYNDREDASLLISLTSYSDGEPDLYVSKGSETKPTTTEYTWKSVTWQDESILISYDDALLKRMSMKGHYMIGVYGRSSSAYTITVTLDPNPIYKLISGQPFSMNQDKNSISNFSFYNTANSRIKITITPSSGRATIYANTQIEDIEDMYDRLPSEFSYTWSGLGSNDQHTIEIDPHDSGFCSMCNILIAVITQDKRCSYNIVVKNHESSQLLQNGVQSKGSLKSGEWNYYSFEVYEPSDFDVSVTAYSGDPDLYVSTSEDVSFSNYNWTSASSESTEHLFISSEDSSFITGRYTIGVYSNNETTYSISAHTRESLIEMVDGWPQTYSLSYDDSDHLFFSYSFDTEKLNVTSCFLRPLSSEFFPRVYISYKSGKTIDFEKPGPDYYRYKYEDVSDYKDPYNHLMFNIRTLPTPGTWIIGVFGRQDTNHSKSDTGDFELLCSANGEMNILRVGVDTYDVFTDANSKKYELNINEKGTLEVYVVPCTGRVKMEISSNYTIANQDLPDVEVTTLVEGKLIGTVNNAYGKYFVTIYALSTESWIGEVSYQLSSRFTPRGKRPADIYVPGNNGFIKWERIGRDEVKLTWSDIEHEDGSIVSFKKELEYLVFWTDESEIPMNTVCGIYTASVMELADLSTIVYGETFTDVELKHDKKITVNVVGVIPDEKNSLLKYIPYYPIEIDMSSRPKSGGIRLTVLWIVGAIMFIALLASFFFYKRFKRVQRQLEYEMTDVRNVAGVSSGALERQVLSNYN